MSKGYDEAFRPDQHCGQVSVGPDRNVEAVREKLLQRSMVGLNKYGVTTERNDIDRLGWLLHLQEELLDASVYIEALMRNNK